MGKVLSLRHVTTTRLCGCLINKTVLGLLTLHWAGMFVVRGYTDFSVLMHFSIQSSACSFSAIAQSHL